MLRPRNLLFLAVFALALLLAVTWTFRSDSTFSAGGPTPGKPSPTAQAAPGSNPPATPGPRPEGASTPPAVATVVSPAPISAPTPQTRFAEFRAWTEEALTSGAKAGDFQARGVALAQARRVELAKLIVEDPERALAEAIPPRVRQELPSAVVSQLEDRVSTRADYRVLATLPVEGAAAVPAVRRLVIAADGTSYDAYVYGTRLRQLTATRLPINGIAVDGKLAVAESAVRVLAVGEKIAPGTPVSEVCPVSGETVAAAHPGEVPADAHALEIGGAVHFFCGAGHLEDVKQGIDAGKYRVPGDSSGGATTDSAYNQGTKKVLLIRANFTDDLAEPISVAAGQTLLSATSAFMFENSYSTLQIDLANSLVTPVLITMPKTKATYVAENNSISFLADARAAATAAGYNYLNYDFEFVRYASIYGFGGQAYVGGRGVWLQTSSTGVACHEWGHNLGLWHANYWNATNDTIIGSGTNSEYGDGYDTMGSAAAGHNSFNACHRNILGWLPNTNVQSATATGGTYRVFAFDQTTLTANQTLAVKTTKDSTRDYWLEHRIQWASNLTVANGLLLRWSPWGSSNGGSQLLDVTPGTSNGINDSAIVLGRTFSDTLAGVHITPIAKIATTPESIDVVINRGTFPGNRAPVVSIGASATTVAINTAVNFTATASDPDGDALAYYWDFGNGLIGPNSATASTQWSSVGRYNVLCIVSDMKGKTTSRTVLVTVGAPTTFTASGTVTDNYGQTMAGVRVHNGLTGGSYRGTYTDSSGQYTLTNLAAGSYTLGAVSAGFTATATPGFTNPVVVGPSQANLNFVGTSVGATLSVIAPSSSAREAGPVPASFSFTRGQEVPPTAAVTVNYTLTGTADKATDYSVAVTPPATGTYNSTTGVGTVVFPVGTLNAALQITPVDDAIVEGAETVVATVTAGTGYQVGADSIATLVIVDNDSTDLYTEAFVSGSSPNPFDLNGRKLTFTPTSATAYRGICDAAAAFPTDPTGGTVLATNNAAVVGVTSGTLDDGYWQLTGLAAQPTIFGTVYPTIYVNTNGNVSFGSGDAGTDSYTFQHFVSGRKRVSLFGQDLDATKGGTISYNVVTTAGQQRVVVTFANVPRRTNLSQLLNAQVELWVNGTITLTWIGTNLTDGIIGLAAGQASPSPFYATDLSAYPASTGTYAGWLSTRFTPAEIADPLITGVNADPDQDGWSNLLEYALGSDPHAVGKPPGAPATGQAGGYLTLTFRRDPLLTDINYLVEVSDLSGGWTVIAQSVGGAITNAAAGQTPSTLLETPVSTVMSVTVGDTVPMNGATKRFIRLRVTKP